MIRTSLQETMDKQAFEPTGLVPRSIIRTVERFRQQLLPGTEAIAIQEFRISRYQVLVSLRCLATLICAPLLVNLLVKTVLLTPTVEHIWNAHQNEIFINSYQEDRALLEMQNFSEKIFFESLLADINEVGFTEGPKFLESIQSVMRETVVSCGGPYPRPPSWVGARAPSAIREAVASWVGARKGKASSSAMPPTPSANPPKALPSLETMTLEMPSLETMTLEMPSLETMTLEMPSLETMTLEMPSLETILFTKFLIPPKSFVMSPPSENSWSQWSDETSTSMVSQCALEKQFQRRATELAFVYNRESLQAVINLLGDLFTFLTVFLLSLWMKPQIIILKSFLTESIYSLSDTSKSFLLILCTDLLVGFHSPRGWEIAIESLLKHFGLPENQDFIFLFVAAFPVFLDTIFKYWIFRYLNKISPSTVATYHNMIE